MKKAFLTDGPSATKNLGQNMAKKIIGQKNGERAFVLALEGDLGGGKTTFLQGFAKGLGLKEKILSPTFVIMKRFEIRGKRNSCFENFYHFDCYRAGQKEDILDLGFKKIISDSKNIVAIEWADKIKSIIPQKTFWINFRFMDAKNRKITILK